MFSVSCAYKDTLEHIENRVDDLEMAGKWELLNPGDIRTDMHVHIESETDDVPMGAQVFAIRKK